MPTKTASSLEKKCDHQDRHQEDLKEKVDHRDRHQGDLRGKADHRGVSPADLPAKAGHREARKLVVPKVLFSTRCHSMLMAMANSVAMN